MKYLIGSYESGSSTMIVVYLLLIVISKCTLIIGYKVNVWVLDIYAESYFCPKTTFIGA